MKVRKKCMCGKTSTIEVNEIKYNAWQAGLKIQDVFPELHPFERELLISGMCFDCQEKMYNRPAPGHEEMWGRKLGQCTCCDRPVFEKKDIPNEEGLYCCPQCGNRMKLENGVLRSTGFEGEDECTWAREGNIYLTECGHSYNPYVKSEQQPQKEDDICPYCGKPIEYVEEDEEDEYDADVE